MIGIYPDNFRKKVIFLLALLVFSTPIFAQTAERLETLLNEKAITWSQAAAFTLEAARVTTGNKTAFNFAAEKKWLPKNAAPEGKTSLKGVSLLLMKSFDLEGGLFYRIFQSGNHAYRELVNKNVIRAEKAPSSSVTGPEFLFFINRILSIRGE